MSELLDPMHRRYIDTLGVVRPGTRTLEVGCGNGSISAWLAEQVSPGRTISSGKLDEALIDRFLAYSSESNWWTQTITFTAAHGRTLGG
jgi:cyclopropane fatty-acyl-phospholipid synthase-like methyltransferase